MWLLFAFFMLVLTDKLRHTDSTIVMNEFRDFPAVFVTIFFYYFPATFDGLSGFSRLK